MLATTIKRLRPQRWIGRVLIYVAVAIGGVVFAIPFLWMVRTVFMPARQIWTIPPQWIPEELYLKAFDRLFNLSWKTGAGVADTVAEDFRKYMWNSIRYATLSCVGAMVSSAFVGFGFARLRFPGRDKMFLLLLATMILPAHVRVVPTYYLFAKLGWIGTYKPLIIPAYCAPAFFVFLIRQFFMTIPRELDDAAVIDGCNPLRLFLRVHLPLSLPAIGIVGIFQFNGAWNDFFGPLLYTRTKESAPIAVGLQLLNDSLTYGGDFQVLMAMSLISIIPPIFLFFAAQRRFVEGIVITGVKG
jgi:ABC-type glycerol-3-phosphate transport system permease component